MKLREKKIKKNNNNNSYNPIIFVMKLFSWLNNMLAQL